MRLRGLVVDTTPLWEVPAYRRVWLGSLLSGLGGRMTTFAVALQVYTATGSSAAVGAVGLVVLVPTLVAGLLGGVVADAVDRRRLVLTTTSALTVVSLALAAQSFGGTHLVALYALVAVQALLQALTVPAQRAIVPALLPPALLPSGLALGQLSFQVALVGGPALAGLVTAVGGLRLCYLLDALTFLASLYAVWRLPALRPVGTAVRRSPAAVLEGLRFVRRTPVVGAALLSDLASTALAMPFAIFPAVNALRFGGNPTTLGLLGSAPAVGGVVAMALSGAVRHVARPGLGLLAAGTVWGLALVGFGLAPSLGGVLLALAVAGAADTLAVVLRSSLVQLTTPDGLRGRVSSLEYVVGTGGPELGNARGGLVASLVSPAASAVSGGLSVVVALGVLAACVPQLARHRVGTGAGP